MLEAHARMLLDIPPDKTGEQDADGTRDEYIIPTYSGRGMMGRETCAIVVRDGTSLATLMGDTIRRQIDNVYRRGRVELEDTLRELESLLRESKNWRTDSMGRDGIVIY